ncbi:RAMP superfamily CRISPR-associated protein [Paraglaciecola sp. 20A4]|uniref:RAMP superfamily CRISPR-associated protein n=1 Tax=Paraglaciecola sp. 20A4 TaxID=2687288 RepID=UPI00140D4EF5|nr:RAMP superfamily CRISPR-associated protein [Paraglaciecola sp. 20A4]
MNTLLIKAQANIAIVIETPLSIGDAEVQVTNHKDEGASIGDAEVQATGHNDEAKAKDECFANTRILPRDGKNRPYIPAASIKGALRQWLLNAELPEDKISQLLGHSLSSSKTELKSGACRVYPAFAATDVATQVVTQNSIDEITGASKANQLFKREYICSAAQLSFELRAEFIDGQLWHEMLSLLHKQTLQIGAGSKNDFGRIKLTVCTNTGMTKNDINHWLNQEATLDDSMLDLGRAFVPKKIVNKGVSIDFTITSPDPILIADPVRLAAIKQNAAHQKPKDQYTQLDKHGRPTLPASSLRGALRAQYRRIVRTLLLQHVQDNQRIEEIVEQVCQPVWGDQQHQANLKMNDATHQGHARAHQQTAIAIDRFTGGAKNGAMAELEGVISNAFSFTITLTPKLLQEEYALQRSILLFLFRDMYEQDISIGAHKSKGFGRLSFTLQTSALPQNSEFSPKVMNYLLELLHLELTQIDEHLNTLLANKTEHTTPKTPDTESAHV